MKDIPNYEGFYAASEDGRIWSYSSKKFLKPSTHRDGYLKLTLSKNGKVTTNQIHRLVAQAFIANPDNLPMVNHIDGIKDNNNVSNLEWVSHIGNMRHAMDAGLSKGNSALVGEDPIQMKTMYTDGSTIEDIAKYYGCGVTKVYQVLKNLKVKVKRNPHNIETRNKMSNAKKGKPSSSRKLTCETARLIKEQTKMDRTNKSIAIEFNVGEHVVGQIKRGIAYVDCF